MIRQLMDLWGMRREHKPLPTYSVNELKKIVKILFVDDRAVKKAEQLRRDEGWRNITKINDVEALAQKEVEEADIIFVDVHGVGKKMEFEDEGLGLIVALRKTYPEKKIVLYSAEEYEKIDAFHEAADLVDARLRKGSDLYAYNRITTRLAKEAICFDVCVQKVCRKMKDELGIDKPQEEVEHIIRKIYDDELYKDDKSIAKAFSLQDIGAVAEIIKLFFGSIIG